LEFMFAVIGVQLFKVKHFYANSSTSN